jgi:2-polyprenyl-6-methoxyphenol hydroxylase-like FAD-dependent oxidoreductase
LQARATGMASMSMADRATGDAEVPVLIVGGGLIGLATAMFLAQHGIRSLAIERLRAGSPLPRAGHFHLRTIELFRSAGIEDEARQQSEQDFVPEGAIIAMDSLAGRKLADIIPGLNVGVDDTLTPIRRMFINQPGLERILRKRADQVGAAVRTGCELVNLAQDADGVTATVRDVDTGAESRIRAQYVVGADGAHSRVRELLGIPLDGRGIFSNSMTIYFHADVWPQLGGKPLSVIYINNPVFGGFFRFAKDCQSGFLGVNTVGDPKVDPVAAANAAADISEARLTEIVRSGIGVPDLPVKIDGCTRWRATSDVARKFQDGRLFLVGDAAHLMPPNGGFGGNTGIHDAHNIAWKLAFVLKGVAGAALLDSYEAERKPVARFTVEQAYTRYVTRTATYLGAKDYLPIVHDFNIELGTIYHSRAILEDGEDRDKGHDDPRATRGRPGARAPHLWVESAGVRRSTLDLFGRDVVLLAGPGGEAWCTAAERAARSYAGLALKACCVGGPHLRDADGRFGDAYDLGPAGACLVRPDGIVAWRAKAWRAKADGSDREATIAQALDALLARA